MEKDSHAEVFSRGYKTFLNACKTERETASRAVEMAREAGFQPLREKHGWGEFQL